MSVIDETLIVQKLESDIAAAEQAQAEAHLVYLEASSALRAAEELLDEADHRYETRKTEKNKSDFYEALSQLERATTRCFQAYDAHRAMVRKIVVLRDPAELRERIQAEEERLEQIEVRKERMALAREAKRQQKSEERKAPQEPTGGPLRPCPVHPKYQAKRTPRTSCEGCWEAYRFAHPDRA